MKRTPIALESRLAKIREAFGVDVWVQVLVAEGNIELYTVQRVAEEDQSIRDEQDKPQPPVLDAKSVAAQDLKPDYMG